GIRDDLVTGVQTCALPIFPIHYDTDREAIDAALASAGLAPAERARVVRIRNTLRLDRLFVSEACRAELAARGDVEIVEPAHELRSEERRVGKGGGRSA